MYKLIASAAALSVAAVSFGFEELPGPRPSNSAVVEFEPGFLSGSFQSARGLASDRVGAEGDIFFVDTAIFSSGGGAFLNGTAAFSWSGPGAGPVQGFGNSALGSPTAFQTIENQSGNTFTIQANTFTTDSSDFLPNGVSVGGAEADELQYNVGSSFSGFNPIDWDGGGAVQLVDFGIALFVDGNQVFSQSRFGGAGDNNAGNDLAGSIAVVNAEGQGVDELAMFWVFDKVPAPGATALFGLAGLAVARRRRA